MKIIIILFVLFSSSSVSADDDLKGTQLICFNVEKEKYTLFGYEFLPDFKFLLYDKQGLFGYEKESEIKFSYQAKLNTIRIYSYNDELKYGYIYKINRTNLNFLNLTGELLYKGTNCKVLEKKFKMTIKDYVDEHEEKIISQIKSKNKI